MYLYQATKDPWLLEVGVDVLESIESNCKTKCGYATVCIIGRGRSGVGWEMGWGGGSRSTVVVYAIADKKVE